MYGYVCSTEKSTFLMKPTITSHVNYCTSVGATCWLIWNNVTSQMGQSLQLWRTEPQAENMNSSHLFVAGTPSAGPYFSWSWATHCLYWIFLHHEESLIHLWHQTFWGFEAVLQQIQFTTAGNSFLSRILKYGWTWRYTSSWYSV